MALKLYAHPFSSYCQKGLIAFYENATPFDYATLESAENNLELERAWPIKRFPVLTDGAKVMREASIIIEYLDVHYRGSVRFIPEDAEEALDVRFMDRFFDNYIMTPQQKIVFDSIRSAPDRDPAGVAEARKMLETSYGWLDGVMKERAWACGKNFSLADCGAAPALFYADWTHEIGEQFPNVKAYRKRLLARPSFARAVDEARPYREYFPLGAPDRD
jgi:glutathione S-transferase